jgi:hypothetical protein
VPGRLDQQTAHVRVADLGDQALPAALTRGVLCGHESTKAMNSRAVRKRLKSPISMAAISEPLLCDLD